MSKVPPAPTLSKGCVVHCRSQHDLVLEDQRERILKTRTKHDSELEQLAFGFADHELRQLRDNRSYWDKRLARIERDLELEPAAIRRTFEVATAPRIEPAGAIVLWPLEGTR